MGLRELNGIASSLVSLAPRNDGIFTMTAVVEFYTEFDGNSKNALKRLRSHPAAVFLRRLKKVRNGKCF